MNVVVLRISLTHAGRLHASDSYILYVGVGGSHRVFKVDYITGSMNFAASLKVCIYNRQSTHHPKIQVKDLRTQLQRFVCLSWPYI